MAPATRSAIIAASLLLLATYAAAQPRAWTRIGPWGGTRGWISKIGGTLYTAADDIYSSTNYATTWALVDSNRAAAMGAGFISHGSTAIGLGRPWTYSTNAGSSWKRIDSTPTFNALAFDGNAVIGAANTGRVLRSTDLGATWDTLGWAPTPEITAIAAYGNAYYLGTKRGLFRSIDRGASWRKIVLGPDSLISAIYPTDRALFVTSQNDPRFNYKRLYRTSDSGASWTKPFSSPAYRINSIVQTRSALFAAGSNSKGNLLRSTDDGTSWSAPPGSFPLELLSAVAFGDTILVGSMQSAGYGGISRSFDGGATWTISERDISALPINSISTNGNTILVASDEDLSYTPLQHGIFATTDGGITWNSAWLGLNGAVILTTAAINDHLIATIGRGGNSRTGYSSGSIYTSTDNGVTWNVALDDIIVRQLVVHGERAIINPDNDGLKRSTDGGATWQAIATPSASTGEGPGLIFNHDSNLFAMARTTLFRSTDDGTTWRNAGYELANIGIAGIAASTNAIIINTARSFGKSVLIRSTDEGANWNSIDENFDGKNVGTMIAEGHVLFAATDSAIYRSNDDGEHWLRWSDNPPGGWVTVFAIDGTTLYAGTAGTGVYRTSINDAVDSPIESATIFPNPSLDHAALRFTLRAPAMVRIDLFDALGQLVMPLRAGNGSAGEQSLDIDLTGEPAGNYFCRILVGDYTLVVPVERI